MACEDMAHSTLYTMIPSAVRSRMPVLTSLRRSAKAVILHDSRTRRPQPRALSCPESFQEKERAIGFAATVPSSGASTPTTRPNTPEEHTSASSQELSLKVLSQQRQETSSGVDWDVAATGVRLWITAKTQAEQGGGDVNALRSMHIDALRYMHMALPENLTALEVESLRASMSPRILYQSSPMLPEIDGKSNPSLLRQGVARVVCWVIAGILLVLPVIMAFLNRALQFERQHQLTEKVLANGLDLTSALGERSLELQRALSRFKDGPLGSACADAGSWFIEGIVGGVNDGIDAVAQGRARAS
ncbi:hypothetical protein PV08_11363 [Exophiala spinifera]|uniref:Uncharacterized protein n=1 Tax=Exophiala spinifera TaxID=91928 RepID=A0A0D1Y689_9EURO|nr:uncharacterized protein PV08_11363 [Exophiala spinifera]KIW10401.1 hypothetical protein PV08_11363 [Exophiala spinifera]